MESPTPKFDAMIDYMKRLDPAALRAVTDYGRRMQRSGLGTPTLEMIRDFVAVFRSEKQVPQYLRGDGFDHLDAA